VHRSCGVGEKTAKRYGLGSTVFDGDFQIGGDAADQAVDRWDETIDLAHVERHAGPIALHRLDAVHTNVDAARPDTDASPAGARGGFRILQLIDVEEARETVWRSVGHEQLLRENTCAGKRLPRADTRANQAQARVGAAIAFLRPPLTTPGCAASRL
jgi:hypothetical protein